MKMARDTMLMTSSVLLLWILGTAAQWSSEESCLYCRQAKVFQERVCNAVWVMHAKVTKVTETTDQTEITAEVIEQFKPDQDERLLGNVGSEVTMYTANTNSFCYLQMTENQEYVFSGWGNPKVKFDVCSNLNWMISEDFPMSDAVHENLKKNFLDNCECKISLVVDYDNAVKEDKACVATYEEIECLMHHTFCKYSNRRKECSWYDIENVAKEHCPYKGWSLYAMGDGGRG